jgi:hypothetical protein
LAGAAAYLPFRQLAMKLFRSSPVRLRLFAVVLQERINICRELSVELPLPLPLKQSDMKTFLRSPERFCADACALQDFWRSCDAAGAFWVDCCAYVTEALGARIVVTARMIRGVAARMIEPPPATKANGQLTKANEQLWCTFHRHRHRRQALEFHASSSATYSIGKKTPGNSTAQ